MGKRNIKVSDDTPYLLPGYKSYSIDEIMAAGGTTALANKLGKSAQSLTDRLKKLPEEAFLTEDEFLSALETLNRSK